MVDPQTVLLTGLTRDGTFYIENGADQISAQEFPLQRIAGDHAQQHRGAGQAGAGQGRRDADLIMVLPPMKIRDFTFTSLSDAV